MRNLVLSVLILCAYPLVGVGQITDGEWTYIIENGGATITASTATGAVTIPSELGGYAVKKVGSGYTMIFGMYNESVTSVVIPSSVTSIDYAAFCFAPRLASVIIPNSVTSIGGQGFEYCTSLGSIIIPNSVTSIGNRAFANCHGLANINIPNSVMSIGGQAFENSYSLRKINLPTRFLLTYQNFSLTESQVSFGNKLAASCNTAEGTIFVNPDKLWYESNETIVMTANPKSGYLFYNWSGDSVSTTSPITLTMDSDKTVIAHFIQDSGDNDGDSLTNYQESITYGTNPNQKDSNLDGVEDGVAVSLGYSPTFNFAALTNYWQSNPPTGLYTASQMQAIAIGDIVLTKNANGSFTLNYDIEQSTDLQTWTTYEALSLPLEGLPTDKAFVRIKAKQ